MSDHWTRGIEEAAGDGPLKAACDDCGKSIDDDELTKIDGERFCPGCALEREEEEERERENEEREREEEEERERENEEREREEEEEREREEKENEEDEQDGQT